MERKSEIEAKKARLAELRRLKELRKEGGSKPDTKDLTSKLGNDNADKVLENIGISLPKESPSSDISITQLTTTVVDIFDVESQYKRVETYNKEVQTSREPSPERDPKALDTKGSEELEQGPESSKGSKGLDLEQDLEDPGDTPKITKAVELTEDGELDQFADQGWKIIGRAVDIDYDVTLNYGEESNEPANRGKNGMMSEIGQFSSHSQTRAITDLDWSVKTPELVASAYSEDSSDFFSSKGLVNIWNIHMKTRPEYELYASSNILSVKFSPFDSRLIFGGAYNGQVLSWDIRAGPKPVLSSPLSGVGHLFPIYSLLLSGTQNANYLMTCSTDGTLCKWGTDMLARPQSRIQLRTPVVTKVNEVTPTCISLTPWNPSIVLVGAEDGVTYQCNQYTQAGVKAGLDKNKMYRGHQAPITGISCHSSSGHIDFSQYFITSSLDWSLNLWKLNSQNPAAAAAAAAAGNAKDTHCSPVATFKCQDSVYDVKWSPTNPNVFASVDGTGHVEIWDLNKDTSSPWIRVKPSSENTSDISLNRPLNKLAWAHGNDEASTKLAVGGLDGKITIFDIKKSYMPPPTAQDFISMKNVLTS